MMHRLCILHMSVVASVVLVLALVCLVVPPATADTDCPALRALYDATNGDSWYNNDGWKDGNATSCCTQKWWGVTCTAVNGTMRVTGIDLPNNALDGSLPQELNSLTELVNFTLTSNTKLTGQLSPDWSGWTSIEVISLSNTSLHGPLPTQWGQWQSIRTIELDDCPLHGELPSEYSAWKNLEKISIVLSGLSGTLPPSWGAWSNVSVVDLSKNYISGPLPPTWSNMSRLSALYVDGNYLTGSIDSSWKSLTNLNTLYVRKNMLNGTLDVLASLPKLSILFACCNQFSGTLPSTWASSATMERLRVFENQLSGLLPWQWSEFARISEISVGNNQISGPLPSQWANMSSIITIGVSSTMVYGALPSEWARLNGTLKTIEASDCQLVGSIPPEWGALKLNEAWLNGNGLTGSLPEAFSMSSLILLDLSNNEFSGGFPAQWNSFERIVKLDVSHNKLSGAVSVCSSTLSVLGVMNNSFTSVSDCMGNTGIVKLDLQDNPIASYPRGLETKGRLSVLNLSGTGLELSLSDLNLEGSSPSVLKLANNPKVSGDVLDLVRITLFSVSSTFLELDLSNTSIRGDLSDLDPSQTSGSDTGVFPLQNLNTLKVGTNDRVVGSLPLQWLHSTAEFTLDVTSLKIYGNASTLEFSTVEIEFYDGYHCPGVVWPDKITVLGLTPAYYGYTRCSCNHGYAGVAPNCTVISERSMIIGLGVTATLLANVLLIIGFVTGRRWYLLLLDVRRAREVAKLNCDRDFREGNKSENEPSEKTPLTTDAGMMNNVPILDFRDLWIVKELGSGAQGSVSLAIWKRKRVAVKMIRNNRQPNVFCMRRALEDVDTSTLHEARIHSGLQHDNILELKGVCLSPLCLVTEHMERGSLQGVIENFTMPLTARYNIALAIARGMSYLHEHAVIHRDLKSANVLINSRGDVKIADFDISRSESGPTMTNHKGTNCWMAPEIIRGVEYSCTCDVYSYGIVLWELCMMKKPYTNIKPYDIKAHVEKGGRPEIPDTFLADAPKLADLMQRCWDENPNVRPPFTQIISALEDTDLVAEVAHYVEKNEADLPTEWKAICATTRSSSFVNVRTM